MIEAAIARRGDARTLLARFVGRGQIDDCYVVEKFRSLVNGNIVRVRADGPSSRAGARLAARSCS